MNTDEIAKARISAIQAIVLAVIGAAVSIVTTLYASGALPRRDDDTAAGVGPLAESSAVLNAPVIRFRSRASDSSLRECMGRARSALEAGGFSGVDVGEYTALGYRGDHTGAVWCHTDARQVIFVAAGRDGGTADAILTVLERSH